MVWRWGHKVVCEIAFRLAEPETLARIRRLIRNDPGYDFFSDSYPWPDHPKLRRNEHCGRKSPPSLRSVRRRPCAAAWSASPRADLAIIDPFAASGCEGVALSLGLPLAPRDYLLRSAIQSVRIRAVSARADRRRVGRAGLLALQLLHDAEPPPDVSGRMVLLTTPGALNDPTIFTPDFGAWLRP